ncbi:ABC transporter ATP-binding protein [Thermoflavimicrobium dichotomicum]|uniref:Branched-chain amino acid transport system ATP-binding protein n=1 Tax=Thermoflavimicrobium dichotomicum TaxID=46223 RepID=A0A1I3S8V7_9BACL|nr:ABC transporter ATP-binding protein [Thermoflavimicrobium dichotomicum]SFJ55224.1 branched-chain amino acid transport system ATP-binding protein [Thermoflavimicrobium dichotomicum]
MFSVKNVVKRFGGLIAVDHVSFEIQKGGIFGIIGPNGAGKTTLFNLIMGNLALDEGEIRFHDQIISGKKTHEIAALGIGRTFQMVKPFGGLTVEQNVLMGALPKHNTFQEARKVARQIMDLLELTPYQDEIAQTLPVGLKKKLELARALATQPQLLFLDEVMGGLHPREVQDMIEVIRYLNREQNMTICMIEHVMSAVMALCDRILVLQQGRKLAEGTVEEVTRNPEVIQAYLGGEFKDVTLA